jgi:hypothetical protein
MGTVMDVAPFKPPLVSVAVTVTEPDAGSLAAGMLMSNFPATIISRYKCECDK